MKKKIYNTVTIVIIAIISIFFISNTYQRYILKNKLPTFFGYGYGIVLSGSMEPVLSINDLIITKEQEDYKVGDIVIFENGNILTTHRIIKKNKKEIITQGDANNVEDKPIKKNVIKGKLVYKIKDANIKINIAPATLILLLSTVISPFLYITLLRSKVSAPNNAC